MISTDNIVKLGLKAEQSETAGDKNLASAVGSGGLDVYATPSMIALMEKAALAAVDPLLPPGWATVGTEISVRHLSATPPGMKVTATAELTDKDDRALTFKVEAFDEAGKIGEGTHGRFIIEKERFMAKTGNKKAAK